jgi:hypothetical protein
LRHERERQAAAEGSAAACARVCVCVHVFFRVGQDHIYIYGVYGSFWQEIHRVYGLLQRLWPISVIYKPT